MLCFFYYIPYLHRTYSESFRDMKSLLPVPGSPPIPTNDVPKPLQERDDPAYVRFHECAEEMQSADGVIVNSFEKLEPRAIQAIIDGECIPGRPTPPLYCIGPLISSKGQKENDRPACLAWLDAHPGESVAFLCFGSLGVFSEDQLKAIANGLERSRQRFLWVVKDPAATSKGDFDLGTMLPEGFLERTKGRGMVLKSWAPQVEVLRHGSVGGFVTHCGWNSVLEAVCAGVPMAAWPLYAEQRLNRVLMVEEIGIALPMEESEGGFVTADEVERRINELMDSDVGERLREKMRWLRVEADVAMSPGGSSYMALSELVASLRQRPV